MTLIDITAQEKRVQQEQKRRNATIEMAQDVIRNQMFTAQKIAGLLGETTAETKMTLTELMNAMQDNTAAAPEADEESLETNRSGESPENGSLHRNAQMPPIAQEFQEEADGLPVVRPEARPKLKINTHYAKPAQDAPSAEADGHQKGTADGL